MTSFKVMARRLEQREMELAPPSAGEDTGLVFHGVSGSWFHHWLALSFRRIRDSVWFQVFMVLTILGAGVLVGVNTYELSEAQQDVAS